MFVPLHVKSDYSLGYGTASIDELVGRAAELGYRSLALTDLENLYGQVRFHHQCRRYGIRPITGVELRPGFGASNPGSRSGRVILLALDQRGYGNLCRIVSARRGGRGKGEGGDPSALVEKHGDGLVVLSDDGGVVERLFRGGKIPPERLGLLIVRPCIAPATERDSVALASRLGVRTVADLDAVLLYPSDHELHVLQQSIHQGKLMAVTAKSADVEPPQRLLRSPDEVEALFRDLADAVAASSDFAEGCRFQLGGALKRRVPEREKEREELRRLCEAALPDLPPADGIAPERYEKRLEEELSVLAVLGFSGFMLVVAEILTFCRSNGIPVAVRGSAVSSLVLRLLGASSVDPLAHGLLFERFLHEGKTAWPDVDVDIPWHRRDEVISWVYDRFGHDRVAMVAAHHTFRYRSAVREGLKAWGAPNALIERAARAMPTEEFAGDADAGDHDFLGVSLSGAEADAAEPSAPAPVNPPGLQAIMPLIRRLVGRPRHPAVHPGGIIVERRTLDDILPLERAPKGVVITQYDLVAVAELGLVKIDLLGNRCLSEIEETLTLAGWKSPVKLEDIPSEDPAALRLIDEARTVGCFQLESPAMRSLLARLPIRRRSDLVAAVALIRPGAASGAVKETFVRRARGEEDAVLAFPVLADRLSETLGLPIYEEDIMVLLHRSGGLSLAEADEMRRGIVKSGGDPVILASLQSEFLETARKRLGSGNTARARRAWVVAARFAAYSFNKAHAASFALLAYYSAYLKAHHPTEFACALLNHHQGLYPMRTEAAEFLRMGVRLLAPDVNNSGSRTSLTAVEGERAVLLGLDKVKGLTQRGTGLILAAREKGGRFGTLSDLVMRVRLAEREVTALVLSGACDALPPLAPERYPFVHEAVVEMLREDPTLKGVESMTLRLPKVEDHGGQARLRLYQGLVRSRNELRYLEMHLTAHPMALLREEAARCGCIPLNRAAAAPADTNVVIAALAAAMRRVPTRHGPLQFITFEDETGLLEAVVLPPAYRAMGERVTTPGPFLAAGMVRVKQGTPHLEVRELRPFHERYGAYRT